MWEGAPWAHDADVWCQGGTHLTFLRTIDENLGCVWERVGKLGRIPKEWNRLLSTTWAFQRVWKTSSTHSQGIMMINMREHCWRRIDHTRVLLMLPTKGIEVV